MNDMQRSPAAEGDTETGAPLPPSGNPGARKRLLLILAIVVIVAAIIWAIFHYLLAPPSVETDDAYVAGDVVSITARDPGTIMTIHADNTQQVKAGQPLIDMDPLIADIGMVAAEAELARAVRATRSNFSAVDESGAAVIQAEAELTRARSDLGRRKGAAALGAVSGEELAHAQDAVRVAEANLTLARSRETQSRTNVQGTTVDNNPAVLTAIAAYRRAAIVRAHMHVIAPIAGVVAQRTVQLGQQVPTGKVLMSVVPLDRVWIDANFRETQLKDVRIGQPATIVTDIYGDDVVYHGKVIGFSAGSGNAFALLPPQNASGNWIKITQRLPVRIALDPEELRRNPLRIGLSVKATIETADARGSRLGAPAKQIYGGSTPDPDEAIVAARIRRIIAANR